MNPLLTVVLIVSVALTACGKEEKSVQRTPPPGPAPAASNRKPGPAAKEIALAPGATAVICKGTLGAGKEQEFVIAGQEGSVFMAHAVTPERDLDIAVYRADTGDRIRDEEPANPAFFMAHLPATLGYLVAIRGAGAPSPYTLEIEVPFRLVFDRETPSVEVHGTAPANTIVHYLAPASATIDADLVSAPADAYLTVHALDGRRLLLAEANRRRFTGGAGKPGEGVVIEINQGTATGNYQLRVQEK